MKNSSYKNAILFCFNLKSIAFTFLFFVSVLSVNAQWVPTTGPYGIDITTIASDGTNLFAGGNLNSIVYYSNNGGGSWTEVTNGMLGLNVSSIVIQGTNVYVGNYSGGVYLSSNNGASWNSINNGLSDLYVTSLAINGNDVYATTNSGIFFTSNNGNSWTALNIPYIGSAYNSIAFVGNSIYVGTFVSGVLFSDNNGATWKRIQTGLTNNTIHTLVANGSDVFAATDGGIFLAANNDTTWTSISNGLSSTSVLTLLVNGSYLFAGTNGGGICMSTNNGNFWTPLNTGLTSSVVYSLATNGTDIYAGSYHGGVFISSNNGSSWTNTSQGIKSLQVNSIVLKGSNVISATQSGIFLSPNNGNSWAPINTGLPAGGSPIVYALAVSGNNIFAAIMPFGIYLSTNNGNSWNAVNNGLTATDVISLTVSGTTIFAGTASGGVFQSTNNGSSWIAVNNGLPNDIIYAFTVSGSTIYTATQANGVYQTINNGATWTPANNGLPNYVCYSLANNSTTVFTGTYEVYSSNNNGASWTAPSNSTNYYVLSLAANGTTIFAGTNGGGVFLSTDNGASWTAVNTGIIGSEFINSLCIKGNTLFAGTVQNGVWKRSIPELICSVNLPLITTPGTAQICSGDTLNINLNSNIPSNFSWQATPNAAVNGAHISAQTSTSIADVLTSNSTQQVIYSVTPTSIGGNCVGNTQTISVTVNQLPQVSVTTYPDSCKSNGAATAVTSLGTPPYSYSWSNGVLNQSISGLLPATYSIHIQDANLCTASASGVVGNTVAAPVPICLATVDTLSQHNVIVWEKPVTTYIDSFRIYREDATNIFTYIASIDYTAYSEYTDTSSLANPLINSKRYKMATKDVCGQVSALSKWHNTILLSDQQNGNFSWNFYEVEGQTSSLVSQYILQRYDSASTSWTTINTTAGTQNTMIAPGYSTHQYSLYRVLSDLGAYGCTPTARIATGVNNTRSNIKNKINPNAIYDNKRFDNQVKLQPNPATDIVQINSGVDLESIRVFDYLGREVLYQKLESARSKKVELSFSTLPAGLYTAVCKGKDFEVRKKLVVE